MHSPIDQLDLNVCVVHEVEKCDVIITLYLRDIKRTNANPSDIVNILVNIISNNYINKQ